MSVPAYPSYRDSGVKWLGPAPTHWRPSRFKQVFKERSERSETGEEELLSVSAYTGVTPRSEIIGDGDFLSRAESLEGYKKCEPGDLVMNIMLAWNRGLGITNYSGIVSPAYSVFKIQGENSPRFLDYLVRSDATTAYFKAFSAGVIDSRLRLYPDVFGSLRCVLPPAPEQVAIAAFLDRETAKIDALVEEQRRLVELLKEKRQAVISHAVTKGLDPTVPMKDSGVEWLGEVPAHWEAVALKRLCDLLKDGTHLPPQRVDEGIPLLSVRNVQEGKFDLREDDSLISQADYEQLARTFIPQPQDVLLAIVGATLGKSALVPDGLGPFHIQRSLAIFRPSPCLLSAWLHAVFESSGFQKLLWRHVGYSAQPGIYLGVLGDFGIPVPPLDEQTTIIEATGKHLAQIDDLLSTAESAITFLQERRSALISAAVTGKIDVRGLAPKASEAA